jgi:tetratricopeptide (TPR) repeat protein
MPGVHRLTFSDALLYSPPEQLRSRNGYEGEAGYRWDVYAFGVLAYRLLNGAFPRADKLFQWLCPSPGENQRLDIDADHEGIAEGLEQQGEVLWPHEAACEKERAFRKVIDSCLELDPRMRPLNMREVAQKFEVIEVESAQKEERDRLETLKKEAEQRCRGFSNRFRTASVVALILSLAWGGAQFLRVEDAKSKLFDYRKSVEVKEKEWADQRNAVIQSEGEAIVAKEIIEKALAQEKSLARDVIGSAQKTNEKLFDWLLEEGVDGLPVLEARITRLEFLIKEVSKQLEFVSGSPELAPQARVLKLRRAELGLAMGDLAKGEAWLKEAIGDPKLPSDLAAKAKLRYLLLASKLKPSSLKEDLSEIEVEILSHYGGGGSAEIRVKAALSLVKARVAESNGDNSAALAGYHESLRSFQDLEKLHPANTNIGFMIGRSYLSAAVIAEEERASGNAAKLRGEAAAAFASLAEKKANSTPETQYQIASAIASQALSLWQQGDSFGAEKLAREGVTRLIALQRKMPGDARIAIDLAAQQGIIATTLRDEGKSIEARRLLMEGITLIKNGVTQYTDNFSARYLLASLKWQLSGILGQQGDVNEENRLVMEAHDELRALLENPTMERPRPSEVRKSLAYLCGDLGHASELGRKREEAIGHFQECKRLWQELKRDEGNQLEVEEGYQWAVNRLAEMGVK